MTERESVGERQLEQIGEVEKRLWASADTLRANSNFASNEYFLPVMGLIFLRHAYSRFLKVKGEIEEKLPTRGGKKRELTKEDFSQKGAIFLREESQFDYLVERPDSVDRAKAIIQAMTLIEQDYESLEGTLPKNEYQELDNDVLGRLLKVFNDPALKHADGDIFGRIYEYFLTGFADMKAHDGGEFFTPASIVQMIVNVIEPDHGTVLDPACGSGGMFVQSAHFIERMKKNPGEQATFYPELLTAVRSIGAPTQRKCICDNDFGPSRGAPRCRHSVARARWISEAAAAANLWALSTAAR